jgi:pimeloyl-ACP methyl ester carboxylesterase
VKILQYQEYGNKNQDVIILLHGGGLSWWNYREIAENLQDDYRVILPILDGHAGSDRSFTSIRDNAIEIISFINQEFNGKVLMIGGVSLGAQILLEMLSIRSDICKFSIVESALVIPSDFTKSTIKPVLDSTYRLIRQKWFARLQFKYLKIREDLFEDYYRDTCVIEKADMIAFLQENSMYSLADTIKECNSEVYVFVGENENHAMFESAEKIHQMIPASSLEILPGLCHGEFSINCSTEYIKKLREIVNE